MKLLLIGNSTFAQKRLLPALAGLHVAQIDVASHARVHRVDVPAGMSMNVFDDYDIAMRDSDAELVYLSTRNHTHATLADKALRRGFYFIFDKRACLSLDDTKRLVDLATTRNRCLAEATVYAYHPQIQVAQDAFAQMDGRPTRLTATFSFPPLAADNFRYQKALGGGALWDLGPYAVTPGRLFFGTEPQDVICRIMEWGDEVETSFSVLLTYSGGRAMVGHFGFNTGYRNRLDILGPNTTVTIDRVFSMPADMENVLCVNQGHHTYDVTVPPADHMALFLRSVFRAIATGAHDPLAQTLLSDATILHRLRQASHVEAVPASGYLHRNSADAH